MAGIEILSTAEVLVKNGFSFLVFLISMGVGAIISALFTWQQSRNFQDIIYSGLLGALCGALVGTILGIGLGNAEDVYETQYKVVVSEEVSISEFLDTYEIVDRDGKILIVREREETNG